MIYLESNTNGGTHMCNTCAFGIPTVVSKKMQRACAAFAKCPKPVSFKRFLLACFFFDYVDMLSSFCFDCVPSIKPFPPLPVPQRL